MDARAGADAVRDDEVEMDERRGKPDAAAVAAREVSIGEALAFVVDGADVDERAEAGCSELRGDVNGARISAEPVTSVSPMAEPVLKPRRLSMPPSMGRKYGGNGTFES